MFSGVAVHITLYSVVVAAYVITIISIIGIVVSENRNPVRSLAWITVLLFFPVIGIVLYVFFGRSLKSMRMISRRNKRKLHKLLPYKRIDYRTLPINARSLQLIKLSRTLGGSDCLPGNEIRIFTSGKEKFEAFEADLLSAREFINIQYYIFNNDVIGNRIRNILIDKAKSGVKVRIIYDHVGSFTVKQSFFSGMKNAGIEVIPFLKVTFPRFATHINWRNHRKLAIIDGAIGYIGGMNIADRYVTGSDGKTPWRDTHLRVQGPIVGAFQNLFAIDWNFMGMPLLDDALPKYDYKDKTAGTPALIIGSGPMGQWSNVALMMHHAIANAKECIYIQTPYFLPNDVLLNALQVAALAKVDVRIMIPRKGDSTMLTLASFSYVRSCLNAGIKVYLYSPGMLHAKTLIIDDEIFSTGSANFDFRSIECNYESNIFLFNRETNAQAKKIFFHDMESCTRVDSKQWHRRPALQRAFESLLRLLSPIL